VEEVKSVFLAVGQVGGRGGTERKGGDGILIRSGNQFWTEYKEPRSARLGWATPGATVGTESRNSLPGKFVFTERSATFPQSI
jgi:hypothetical protein